METADQKKLVNMLNQSFAAVKQVLEGVDLELRVYPDSDWRIREILGHLATWDRQVIKSIQAFIEGTEYAIPELELDGFNQKTVDEHHRWTSQQVYEEWAEVRQDFVKVVQAVPHEQFQSDLLYPWGDERGSVSLLVEYMVDHDREHKEEILKAVNRDKE